jgi:hypothetical protein
MKHWNRRKKKYALDPILRKEQLRASFVHSQGNASRFENWCILPVIGIWQWSEELETLREDSFTYNSQNHQSYPGVNELPEIRYTYTHQIYRETEPQVSPQSPHIHTSTNRDHL